ncbi:MAG: iron-containing alcohol dehydrogenase [Desulfobacteraceae bacterium]|jgi:alcohol dehydrogenase class IV
MPDQTLELELRKFVAPEFVFGIGARELVGKYAANFNARKVLVVTDPGVIAAGWTADITKSLEDSGLPYTVFSGVTPNPKSAEVMVGSEVYQQEECNVIVSVGGGSVIDCAKGIGIVCNTRQDILLFEGVDRVKDLMPPLICVPTTGGTSADVSQFCIITNAAEQVKIAIISKAVVPDVSLIDPVVLTSMDAQLTAFTGLDALVHAAEAFVSNASSPFTELHALEAVRVISRNLEDSMRNLNDVELRGKIMYASLEAGLAFSNASLGGVHAMAHSLGGYKDLPHGECNAMLLRHVMDFNFNIASEKYERIGEAMGLDLRGMTRQGKKASILKEVDRLSKAVGITETLAKKGIHNGDVRPLAEKAIKDPCMVTNPRRPNKRDIEVLYEEAL